MDRPLRRRRRRTFLPLVSIAANRAAAHARILPLAAAAITRSAERKAMTTKLTLHAVVEVSVPEDKAEAWAAAEDFLALMFEMISKSGAESLRIQNERGTSTGFLERKFKITDELVDSAGASNT